eukprot:CAMPEP_0118982800 /NCGR_PEP_ID=MMETSP1173-20130426/33750_1 /TAXON_ID=1034831 /ORGANISM="Rhizochromulina marina cf, Strain CCMP1243" /LENGTH=303 /DNA_ID=CAMNT_0006933327 /DNA_START=61 /DNA_END=973 /DNA_ORIENTATION=-
MLRGVVAAGALPVAAAAWCRRLLRGGAVSRGLSAWPTGAAGGCAGARGGHSGQVVIDPSAASVLREGLAKGAASLPGYGAPDVVYPALFQGSWECRRTLVSLTPAPEGVADPAVQAVAEELGPLVGRAVEFRVRYIDHDGRVVADRAFNAMSQSRAEEALLRRGGGGGEKLSVAEARWSVLNPNVLSLELANGAVRELKVTKRAVEAPATRPGETSEAVLGLGYSEYYRIADSPPGGSMEAVPRLLAKRTQARYKVTADDNVDAIEIEKYYPALSLSSEPAPQLVLKTRLSLSRAVKLSDETQ